MYFYYFLQLFKTYLIKISIIFYNDSIFFGKIKIIILINLILVMISIK